MNMTISKKEANLLLILLGIIIFFLAYFLIFNTYNTKADALDVQNIELEARADTLRSYYENLTAYYTGIETAQQTMTDELAHYPTDVRSEDIIMYAIEAEERVGMDISSIAFTDPSLITTFQAAQENSIGEVEIVNLNAMQIGAQYSMDITYDQVKQLVSLINSTNYRTTLNTLSLGFNSETGALTGSALIYKYFITTGYDEYVPTVVPTVPMGTDDLFATYSVASDADASESESESADDAA